jgi:hypothetical protein
MKLTAKFFKWLGWQIEQSQKDELIKESVKESRRSVIRGMLSVNSDMDSRLDSGNPLRISIHRANGGLIVETRTVDHIKEKVYNELYLITEDQDLGKELADIITMNNLRH